MKIIPLLEKNARQAKKEQQKLAAKNQGNDNKDVTSSAELEQKIDQATDSNDYSDDQLISDVKQLLKLYAEGK